MGDPNKSVASSSMEGGLRAQSRFSHRLGPWVTRIKVLLHHLREVACELNLGAPFGSSHYHPETIPVQSANCALIRGLLIQFVKFIVMLSFEAHVIILRQYSFSLHFAFSSRVHSFNLCDLSSCSLWELVLLFLDNTPLGCALRSHSGFAHSICTIYRRGLFGSSCYYPETIPIQFALCALIRGSIIQSTRFYHRAIFRSITSKFKFFIVQKYKYNYDNVLCSLPLKVLWGH